MKHSFKTIRYIFNKYKIINVPYYQREYVWGTANDGRNLFKFIDDIFNAYKNNSNSTYFIGTLAFCSERVNDVIDGQQRLTSIVLILSVLRERCSDEVIKEHEKLLFPNDDNEFVIQEVSYLTEEIKHALRYDSNFNTQGDSKDIMRTIDKIKSQIQIGWDNYTQEWYDGLYNYILDSVNFIMLEYTNIGDSLKYFLNINSLSIQLTQSDIFYSILSEALRISRNIESIFAIKKQIYALSQIKGLSENVDGYKAYDRNGNRSIDNIIYIFLNARFAEDNNIGSLNNIGVGKWLSFYRNDVFNDQLAADKFVTDFLTYLKDFEYIAKKFNNFNSDLPVDSSLYMSWILLQYEKYSDYLKFLIDLFRIRHNYNSRSLYFVDKTISDQKLEEIAKRLNLTLIWNYIKANNKRLEGLCANISIDDDDYHIKTIDDIVIDISLDDMFSLTFDDSKGVSGSRMNNHSRIIKVIFAFQEAFLNFTAKPDSDFNKFLQNLLDSEKFSIEHLYSVKEWNDDDRRERWQTEKHMFDTAVDFDIARFKFENLSLLNKDTNSSANDEEMRVKIRKYKNAKSVCGSEWEYLIQSLVDDSEYYNNNNIQSLDLPERTIKNIVQNTWEQSENNRSFNEKLMKLVIDYIAEMNTVFEN